jgi:hypothetical protein
MYIGCLQFNLRQGFNFIKKAFGGLTKAREAIFVDRVYLYNMFIAVIYRNISFQCMIANVIG